MDKCNQRVKLSSIHASRPCSTETSVPTLSPSLPAVVAFPAAPSDGPTLAYPSDPAYLPAESSYAPDAAPAPGAEDAPDAALDSDSDAAEETHDVAQQPEQPEDEQQLPRQIHIQQHLKLHFHNQGKREKKSFL